MEYIKKHILIIDDEQDVVNILAEYFETQHYTVTKAYDAKEGMAQLNANLDISLVISDIGLPGMSGLDLLKIAKETKEEIPVIIITGLKNLDHAITAIQYGAKDYIVKPFLLEDVRKVVEKTLRYRNNSEKKARILEYVSSMNVTFAFPTKEADPGVIAHFLANFLLNSGFCNRDQYNQYHVAFMETIINAIEHGNLELPSAIKGDDFEKMLMCEELRENRLADPVYADRQVMVEIRYSSERFTLTVSDEGPGFDWKKYVRSNGDDGINTNAYGRGFLLIHHIIDRIHFNQKGNAITLEKTKANQPINA